jgi:hypothetical protein
LKIKADQGVLDFAEELKYQQDLYNLGARASPIVTEEEAYTVFKAGLIGSSYGIL